MSLKICREFALAGLLFTAASCGAIPKEAADAQSKPPESRRQEQTTAVDVAIARTGSLKQELEYTGTTAAVSEVSIRPQVEGQLLSLNVNVGDTVQQGQAVARLDDALLVAAVVQAEAELASRKSEVSRAQNQVSEALTRVEEARLTQQQAQSDSDRLQLLFREGAISEQQAQQAQTEARTAAQALRTAEAQVSTAREAVAAARGQVAAQEAIVAQAEERLSYTVVNAPIDGIVIQRTIEPGNIVQPGSEVVKLGDFSEVKVLVDVSELELSNIQVGQSVSVRLDAFPDEEFTGEVLRISPAADPTARLIPVEVVIPNRNGKLGSGLLARVNFASVQTERVIVPETALQQPSDRGGAGGNSSASNKGGSTSQNRSGSNGGSSSQNNRESKEGTVFVVVGDGKEAKVQARSVTLGDRADGKVEILSGLEAGTRFVSCSGKPLKDGESVRLSVLSEK